VDVGVLMGAAAGRGPAGVGFVVSGDDAAGTFVTASVGAEAVIADVVGGGAVVAGRGAED
jgi:hypothetical protein